MSDFLNKQPGAQSDEELVKSYDYWANKVRTASGWASAYEAAKALKKVSSEGLRRGLPLVNPFPIVKG